MDAPQVMNAARTVPFRSIMEVLHMSNPHLQNNQKGKPQQTTQICSFQLLCVSISIDNILYMENVVLYPQESGLTKNIYSTDLTDGNIKNTHRQKNKH